MSIQNENDNNFQANDENKVKNQTFTASPESLKFVYQKCRLKEEKYLKLTNVSDCLQRLFILQPITKYFKITHPEKGWIAPGLSISVQVTFEPNLSENARHYKDCIRVICNTGDRRIKKDIILNENAVTLDDSILSIPIVAMPYNPHCNLPDEIDFGCIPLNQKADSYFEISPQPGQKIIYFISLPEENPNFSIEPMYGSLDENDPPAVITITFTPTDYKIQKLQIKVCIPSSSMTPYLILLRGMCKPWQEKLDNTKRGHSRKTRNLKEGVSFQDERQLTIITFNRPSCSKSSLESSSSSLIEPIKTTTKKNKKIESPEIPLNTIYGVNKFLLQKPKIERDPYFDLIGPLGMYQEEEKAIVDKLENNFLSMVKEEKEKLRHLSFSNEIFLGPSPGYVDIEELAEIEVERMASSQHYLVGLQKVIDPQTLFNSTTEIQLRRRILRNVNQTIEAKFSSMPNDMWFLRYQILSKFIEGARKIIIINRLKRRLEIIKKAFLDKQELEIKEDDVTDDNKDVKKDDDKRNEVTEDSLVKEI